MKVPLLLVSLIAAAIPGPSMADDPIRYIAAPTKAANKFVLWSSYRAATQCGHAMLAGRDVRKWCEEGTGPSHKPKLGKLDAGTRVERLDSTECDAMVQIRVLDGPLTGAIGCVSTAALTSVKPAP